MGLPVISQDQVIYCTQTRVWTGSVFVPITSHNQGNSTVHSPFQAK